MTHGTAGTELVVGLADAACNVRDWMDTTQAFETQTRVFPVGLPLSAVVLSVYSGVSAAYPTFTGYLIPAGQLPPVTPATKLPARLAHPQR